MEIKSISDEDRAYLELFTNLQTLTINNTGLVSLANLPTSKKLTRIELGSN